MKNNTNITISSSPENAYSESGKVFHREKYLPKIDFIKNYYSHNLKDKSLLDVGIGYGVFLNLLETEFQFRHLYGMDPYLQSIEISKQHTSAILREGMIEDPYWPFDQKFDIITCFDVIEHLEHPGLFFKHAKRYLNANGIIIIATPNKQLPYVMRSLPWIGIPDINPTHINVKNPRYWIRLAKRKGYEILATWKGEHLTHIRFLSQGMTKLFKSLNIDHRKIPVINAFEQAFNMIIRIKS